MIGHPNLILWSDFTGGAANLTGGANGSLTGSPSFSAGVFGQKVDLNGTSQGADYGDNFDLDTVDFSLVIGFTVTAIGAASRWVVGKIDGNYPDWYLYITTDGKVEVDANRDAGNYRRFTSTSAISAGVYIILGVSVSRSAGTVAVYKDGVSFSGTTSSSGAITGSLDNAARFNLGYRDISWSRLWLPGSVDFCQLYKGVALGASDHMRISHGFHPLGRS